MLFMEKKIILLFCFFYLNAHNLFSNEYEILVFNNTSNKSISTLDGYKFTTSEAIGNWQDSLGSYGTSRILFFSEVKEEANAKIKGLGEFIDHKNQKFWAVPTRESALDAGVGKIKFISATDSYKFLLDRNCNYAIKYLKNSSYLKILCN